MYTHIYIYDIEARENQKLPSRALHAVVPVRIHHILRRRRPVSCFGFRGFGLREDRNPNWDSNTSRMHSILILL